MRRAPRRPAHLHATGGGPALSLVVVILTAVLAAGDTSGQAFVTLKGKEPIPREGFKSWSLILVTNQDWLIPQNAQRLQQLYDRSQAFGRVIGREHAAVWFWKKDTLLQSQAMADNVDVDRAVAFCKSLGLRPSAGPYLVFTTAYPDENNLPSTGYLDIALGGRTAEEIGRLLSELGDQLVAEGVVRNGTFQQAPGSDDFWSTWFDATRHALVNLKSVFCFAVHAPSFTIEAGCKRDVS